MTTLVWHDNVCAVIIFTLLLLPSNINEIKTIWIINYLNQWNKYANTLRFSLLVKLLLFFLFLDHLRFSPNLTTVLVITINSQIKIDFYLFRCFGLPRYVFIYHPHSSLPASTPTPLQQSAFPVTTIPSGRWKPSERFATPSHYNNCKRTVYLLGVAFKW